MKIHSLNSCSWRSLAATDSKTISQLAIRQVFFSISNNSGFINGLERMKISIYNILVMVIIGDNFCQSYPQHLSSTSMTHRLGEISYCPIPVSISTLTQMFMADMQSKKTFLEKISNWSSQGGAVTKWDVTHESCETEILILKPAWGKFIFAFWTFITSFFVIMSL